MLKEIGSSFRTNAILIPHSPGTLTTLTEQMRNAMIEADQTVRAPEAKGEASAPPPDERHLMKIRPLYDRILAKRLAGKDKTAGGLIIPDTAKEKPLEALVVSVGSGKLLENGKTHPLTVKAGDTVLIGKYSGSEVILEGEDHIVLREDDILAVIEK